MRTRFAFSIRSSVLVAETGQPEKVCIRAIERSSMRDLIEFGVSLRTAWPTDRGLELLVYRDRKK